MCRYFWDGFSAGLNHAAHAAHKKITITIVLKELSLEADGAPNKDNTNTMSLVKKSRGLSKWYKKGGIKGIIWEYVMNGRFAGYTNNYVFLNGNRIHTNYTMISNLFHEFRHGWQFQSNFVKKLQDNGNGYHSDKNSITLFLMEMDAHNFQISLGDYSSQTTRAFNHYLYLYSENYK